MTLGFRFGNIIRNSLKINSYQDNVVAGTFDVEVCSPTDNNDNMTIVVNICKQDIYKDIFENPPKNLKVTLPFSTVISDDVTITVRFHSSYNVTQDTTCISLVSGNVILETELERKERTGGRIR